MQLPLVAAVTLTLLVFVWGQATESDKQQCCNFLQDAEKGQEFLLEILMRKALAVGKKVLPKLGKGSSFETFIKENSNHQEARTSKQKVDFILMFRCAYKNMILANGRYKENPEFQQIYNTYKSESNQEIAQLDRLLSRSASRMLKKLPVASASTKKEFTDALQTYLARKGISAHCMMNRFLMLKTKYECSYTNYNFNKINQ